MTYEFPAVIGSDVAGTVEAIGDGVEGFSVGDRVFGMMGMKGEVHDGSFAELANPQAGSVAARPVGCPIVDAGSLGVAGTTAMSAVDAVAPTCGRAVLVVGATGGVGTFAIQLAALRGAHVIASVRPGDEGFVTDLGAAETVDYTGDVVGRDPRAVPRWDRRGDRRGQYGDEAFGAIAGLVARRRASSCRRRGGRVRRRRERGPCRTRTATRRTCRRSPIWWSRGSYGPDPQDLTARRRRAGDGGLRRAAHARQARHHDVTFGRATPRRGSARSSSWPNP